MATSTERFNIVKAGLITGSIGGWAVAWALIVIGQSCATGSMCHNSQAGDARRIGQASWYGHDGRNCGHKRHVVGQLQQVSCRECKGNLPAYRNALDSTMKYLFAVFELLQRARVLLPA